MGVICDDFADFVKGEVAFVSHKVKFGELDFGAGIRMVIGDLLPDSDGSFGLVEGGHRFSECHKRIAIIVLRIFSDSPFKERTSLRRAFQPKEALAKVCASI